MTTPPSCRTIAAPSRKQSARPILPLAAVATMMAVAPERALGFSTPFAATVPFRRSHHRHSSHLRMSEETNPEVAALLAAAAKARADADRLRKVRCSIVRNR
jgi:hypothetical protein